MSALSEIKADLLREVFGVTRQDDPELAQASLITYASQADAPFLIVQGEADPIVPKETAVDSDRRLKEVGVPSQLVFKPSGYHWEGMRITGDDPIRAEVAVLRADFFDRYLK